MTNTILKSLACSSLQVVGRAMIMVVLSVIVVKNCSKAIAGLWYLCLVTVVLGQYVEFVINECFSRLIRISDTLAKGGNGLERDDSKSEILIRQPPDPIKQTVVGSCLVIAALFGGAMICFGHFYVKSKTNLDNGMAVWVGFSIITSINILLYPINLILTACDHNDDLSLGIFVASIVGSLVAFVGRSNLGGLESALLGLFVFYVSARIIPLVRSKVPFSVFTGCRIDFDVVKLVIGKAISQSITAVAGFTISQCSTIIISSSFGLKILAEYGMSNQIVNFAYLSGSSTLAIFLPKMISMRCLGRIDDLQSEATRMVKISISLFTAISIFILTLGLPVISYFLGFDSMLNRGLISVMLFIKFLEIYHISAVAVVQTNDKLLLPYSGLVCGAATLIVQSLVIPRYGVVGAIYSQLVINFLTINWWPPIFAARTVQLSLLGYLMETSFVLLGIVWFAIILISFRFS